MSMAWWGLADSRSEMRLILELLHRQANPDLRAVLQSITR